MILSNLYHMAPIQLCYSIFICFHVSNFQRAKSCFPCLFPQDCIFITLSCSFFFPPVSLRHNWPIELYTENVRRGDLILWNVYQVRLINTSIMSQTTIFSFIFKSILFFGSRHCLIYQITVIFVMFLLFPYCVHIFIFPVVWYCLCLFMLEIFSNAGPFWFRNESLNAGWKLCLPGEDLGIEDSLWGPSTSCYRNLSGHTVWPVIPEASPVSWLISVQGRGSGILSTQAGIFITLHFNPVPPSL